MKPAPLILVAVFCIGNLWRSVAQEQQYNALSIPDSLTQNADAVVRLDHTHITLSSRRDMTLKKERAVTVLNKAGDKHIDAYVGYDTSIKVKKLEAVIYDASGKEIKKIRQKNFTDRSAVSGFSLYDDNRELYLSYTPIAYPYTVWFTYETETHNTAFVQGWNPLENYYLSTEKSIFELEYLPELNVRFKEKNFDGFPITNESSGTTLKYTATGIKALEREYGSPSFPDIVPGLKMASEKFHLEGVDGSAKNWKEFGKWMHEYLLQGTGELPEATKEKIRALVADKETMREKAEAIYNFVQENTRYISVQIGIGGWKPMLAADVDRLGYGDCKALTNYTKSLLEAAEIPSYYTVVYAGRDRTDIDPDFTSLQGNHVILALPDKEDMVWLECTSQTVPFGYQANFTDNRNVLVITPEGGEIKTTKTYTNEDNYQYTHAVCTLREDGSIRGEIEIKTGGAQYDYRYSKATLPEEDKIKFYKEYWDYINNISIESITHSNDRKAVEFSEKISLQAHNYAGISGNRIFFAVNVFNNMLSVPDRYRNRSMPLEIERGYMDVDEYRITLPAGYSIEAFPKATELTSKFGNYTTAYVKNEDGTVTYKRKILLKKGLYDKAEYKNYRNFIKNITKSDHSKIVLIKNKT